MKELPKVIETLHEYFKTSKGFSFEILLQLHDKIEVDLKNESSNILGGIKSTTRVQSESPKVKVKKSIVLGSCDDDINVTNQMFEFNLSRPNEISYLVSVPTIIPSDFVAVTYDDKFFVIGIGKTCNEIWKFERNSGWKICAKLNQRRQDHCASIVDSVIYVCGGYASFNKLRWKSENILKSVEAYDLERNKCSTVGELVHAVEISACAAYKGLIYVFGGYLEGKIRTDCVQIYNTRDNTCSLLSKPMPSPQTHLRALQWNNSVILLNHWTCFIFDFEKQNWRKRKQFKTDVLYFGLVHDDEKVFVFGGGIDAGRDTDGKLLWKCTDEVRYVRLIDIINDNMVEWKKLGRLPTPSLIYANT